MVATEHWYHVPRVGENIIIGGQFRRVTAVWWGPGGTTAKVITT